MSAGVAVTEHMSVAAGEARERALVEAARDGDMAAFGELYRAHRPQVYRYVLRRVQSPWEAEDITSDTLVRALTRIGNWQWREAAFGAWLITIARNLVADHYKSPRYRREAVGVDTEPRARDDERAHVPAFGDAPADGGDPADGVTERAVARDIVEQVRAALARLTPVQRAAIMWGEPVMPDAVKAARYRARATLSRDSGLRELWESVRGDP